MATWQRRLLRATYTVNSDCTGTEVAQVYQSGQLVRTTTLQIVIDQNGDHARSIFSKVELPDGTLLPAVITLDATRLFPKDERLGGEPPCRSAAGFPPQVEGQGLRVRTVCLLSTFAVAYPFREQVVTNHAS
jgi:hypothetical protein